MKQYYKILPATLYIFAMSSCSSSDEIVENNIPHEPIKIEAHEIEIAQNEVGFGIDLFKALMADNDDYSNTAIGPYSVSTVLTMLANSTDEDVQKEICAALGNHSDVASLTKYHSKLHKRLPKMDNHVDLKLSNSMWVADQYEFLPEFSSTLASSLGAESYKVNFATQEGINKINNWCKNATNGLIPVILEKPIQTDVMLISSTFFDGKWAIPFDKSETKKSMFKTEIHGFKAVDMMHASSEFQYYLDDDMRMVKLPYGNSSYNLSLILPSTPKDSEYPSLKEFIDKFTAKKWLTASTNLVTGDIFVHVPKISFKSRTELGEYLKQIGIEKSLSKRISGITNNTSGCQIGEIINTMNFQMDENGSKVADISHGLSLTSNGFDGIIFNRPFIFIIDEVSTGTILYIGAVQNF